MSHNEIRAAAARRLLPQVRLPSAIAGHGSMSMAHRFADAIELNAVLFITGIRRCVLVSADLLYIGGALERDLREALCTAMALGSRCISVRLHTHFAPPLDSTLPALGTDDTRQSACSRGCSFI